MTPEQLAASGWTVQIRTADFIPVTWVATISDKSGWSFVGRGPTVAAALAAALKRSQPKPQTRGKK